VGLEAQVRRFFGEEHMNFLTMTDQELIKHASKQVKALRMALDMIECEKYERRHVRWAIIDALKEELAAPVQEPVAIPDCGEAGHAEGACGNRECLPSFRRNTTPPAQQEHKGCACRWDSEGDRTVTCERHQGWLEVIAEWADRAREAEAKLKEKNT